MQPKGQHPGKAFKMSDRNRKKAKQEKKNFFFDKITVTID